MSVEDQMNLCALQRVDPYIERIITSASQVALYKFASDEWEKTETEGTLFVYERNCDPQFGFLILNRRSTRNLVEPVTKELDFQLQTPFLLYKTKEAKIFGIWFYEQSDCERVTALVQELVQKTEQKLKENAKTGRSGNLAMLLNKAQNKEGTGSEKSPSSSKANMPTSNGAGKLMNLLTKATSEDQRPREAQPPSPPALLSNQVNGASRPQAQKPRQEAKAEDGNVAAFFAKAASAEQSQQQQQEQQSAFTSPSRQQQQQPPQQSAAAAEAALPLPSAPLPGQVPPGIPLLGPPPPAPLMAAAAAAAAGMPPVMMQPHMMAAAHAAMVQQAQMSQMMAAAAAQQQLHHQQQQPNQRPPPASTASPNPGDKGSSPNPVLARLLSNPEAVSLENIERQQRLASESPQLPKMPATARCAEDLEHKLKIAEAAPKTPRSPRVAQEQRNHQLDQPGGRGSYASAVVNPAVAATREQPKLISPAQLAKAAPGELTHVLEGSERRQKDFTAATTNGEGHLKKVRSVEPLTITQMTQALEYLIKTDKEFVTKLHRAYVDSLNDKLHQ